MDKISVFGSSGFIGNRFCEMYPDDVVRLLKDEYSSPTKNLLYFISTVDNYNIHTDLHIDVDTNLNVLMNVLDAFKKNYKVEDAPIINFISSWFVYGQNENIPFKEDMCCNPTGFYSITKRCAEQMLICFCNTFGYNYRIIRLANVLGETDKKVSKKKNTLQYLIKEIVDDKDVNLYYGGEVIRDYIYVDDVCLGIKTILDRGKLNEVYNLGNGIPYRFLDIITEAIKESESKSRINEISSAKFHDIVQVRNAYLDTTKLNSLGFIPKYDINTIIKKLVNHYKNTK